jgi:hypothetical protein
MGVLKENIVDYISLFPSNSIGFVSIKELTLLYYSFLLFALEGDLV